MVFMCPTKEETENKTKVLCQLKKLLHEIEGDLSVPVNPICVPCCVPLCNLQSSPVCPSCPAKEASKPAHFDPPNVMVCYKIPSKKKRHADPAVKNKTEQVTAKVKPSKSRELRASILYRGCDCEQRNGLQDDCPRTGCHGAPECLTKPPTCGPSEFCNGKHLGRKSHLTSRELAAGGIAGRNEADDKAKYKCFPAVLKTPVCCGSCQ